jgi:hypothetical protein
MRAFLTVVVCFALLVVSAVPVVAQDKDVKLAGNITCAKCGLKIASECATVLVVKDGGKDVIYYIDDKSGKADHKQFCQAAHEGTVTGKVSEKDGKKYITVAKLDLKK